MKYLLSVILIMLLSNVGNTGVPNNLFDDRHDYICSYPCYVTLNGFLKTEQHWGPPNFGETPDKDQNIIVYMIELEYPVNVNLTETIDQKKKNNFLRDIRKIQISFPVSKMIKDLVGQKVTVKGQLIEGVAPSQYTKVTIIADSIKVGWGEP